MSINVTAANFFDEVIASKKPVLIDFWASWCSPCRRMTPLIDEIARELPEVKVGKVNVDEQPELVDQFGVMNIPTLMVFKDGNIVSSSSGVMPKEDIIRMLGN